MYTSQSHCNNILVGDYIRLNNIVGFKQAIQNVNVLQEFFFTFVRLHKVYINE